MSFAQQYRIRIEFRSQGVPSALDLSSLFFDLNRIYVVAYRMAVRAGGIRSYRSRDFYRLPEEVQLSIALLRYESPLLVDLVNQVGPMAVGVTAGTWALIQSLDRLIQMGPSLRRTRADATNAELDVKRKKLENTKLELEIRRLHQQISETDPKIIEDLEQSRDIAIATQQLSANMLKPSSCEFYR